MAADDPDASFDQESLPDYFSEDNSNAPSTKIPPKPPANDVASDIPSDVHSEEWDVRRIIGEKWVDGIKYYAFDWKPTWVPEHDAENAEELIQEWQEWKAKVQTKMDESSQDRARKRSVPQRTQSRNKRAMLEHGGGESIRATIKYKDRQSEV
ncbi:hypothetical protein BGZ61DRAFT_540230 [Ilyonectria robusta]|uniref:uncharacterized protein n=1 Tax=Ilyonectria robusta TaxID=1079257 RepID=UPI001E8E9225|nr:uncharacterized protein BGZ61DRAFT_540230 [Ilyonectria robusta]KAH8659419.1 hypothetical protein BGZ61DRAFT_540230 [Ilyonectria robusta]